MIRVVLIDYLVKNNNFKSVAYREEKFSAYQFGEKKFGKEANSIEKYDLLNANLDIFSHYCRPISRKSEKKVIRRNFKEKKNQHFLPSKPENF